MGGGSGIANQANIYPGDGGIQPNMYQAILLPPQKEVGMRIHHIY